MQFVRLVFCFLLFSSVHTRYASMYFPFILLSIFFVHVSHSRAFIFHRCERIFHHFLYVLFCIDLLNSLIYHGLLTTNRFYELYKQTGYVTTNNVYIALTALNLISNCLTCYIASVRPIVVAH